MNTVKKIIISTLLISTLQPLHGEQFTVDSDKTHTTFNVNFNNNNTVTTETKSTAANNNSNEATSSSVSNVVSDIKMYMSNKWSYWEQKINDIPFDEIKQQIKNQAEFSHKYMIANKKKIGAGCAGVGYSYLVYKLFYAHHYLGNKQLWSAWKRDFSLQALLYMPEEDLADELLLEIQQRYLNPANPTDFLSPLIDFMKDLEKEIKITKSYDKLYTVINKLYLTRFFPLMKYNNIKKSGERVQRLIHLKHIFQIWAAGHNVQTNKPKKKKGLAKVLHFFSNS